MNVLTGLENCSEKSKPRKKVNFKTDPSTDATSHRFSDLVDRENVTPSGRKRPFSSGETEPTILPFLEDAFPVMNQAVVTKETETEVEIVPAIKSKKEKRVKGGVAVATPDPALAKLTAEYEQFKRFLAVIGHDD